MIDAAFANIPGVKSQLHAAGKAGIRERRPEASPNDGPDDT
jgi:hypothetical protein